MTSAFDKTCWSFAKDSVVLIVAEMQLIQTQRVTGKLLGPRELHTQILPIG